MIEVGVSYHSPIFAGALYLSQVFDTLEVFNEAWACEAYGMETMCVRRWIFGRDEGINGSMHSYKDFWCSLSFTLFTSPS